MAGRLFKVGTGRAGGVYTGHIGSTSGGGVSWRIDGIENVMGNIQKQLYGIEIRSATGMKMAARLVLSSAEVTSPKVPVDTGKLRHSTFVDPDKSAAPGTISVEFGYGTKYAAAVHEMFDSVSGRPINWSRPGSGPKFFEASIKRNSIEVVQTIAKYAEIK